MSGSISPPFVTARIVDLYPAENEQISVTNGQIEVRSTTEINQKSGSPSNWIQIEVVVEDLAGNRFARGFTAFYLEDRPHNQVNVHCHTDHLEIDNGFYKARVIVEMGVDPATRITLDEKVHQYEVIP